MTRNPPSAKKKELVENPIDALVMFGQLLTEVSAQLSVLSRDFDVVLTQIREQEDARAKDLERFRKFQAFMQSLMD